MSRLNDLEFYVQTWDSFKKRRKTVNIFGSSRIKWSVATYKAGWAKDLEKKEKDFDWLFYCFGDTWSRIQWEFGFGEPFKNDDGSWDGEKTDVYSVFIVPNRKLLRKMIDEVSLNSCQAYIREERKKRRPRKQES